ncbi:MAG: hypothetical protein K9L32_09630 [Chromatiaceae bacterium]|nr:hypothetical protein [Chromatiaceae bacterium]
MAGGSNVRCNDLFGGTPIPYAFESFVELKRSPEEVLDQPGALTSKDLDHAPFKAPTKLAS